ncbi:hypothetical protein SLA2020_334740 [Shorea laevis]
MGSLDQVDDLTFRINFTGDATAKLRQRVNDKLKEFMGDYTDDTLVEYVIVLLRNGRRKEEARNELNVFLGDDSHPFVSWLWDHLATNLDLYVPPLESNVEEPPKTKSTLMDQDGINDSFKLDSESEREKPTKLHRSRHNREWRGLVRDAADPPPLRSSEVKNIHFEERTHRKQSRGRSPSPGLSRRKRSRTEEMQQAKGEAVAQVKIDAPRRLLQFAVRDAVGSLRPANATKEPLLKSLCSVVSTCSGVSSLPDRSQRLRSVAWMPNPMATVIKAVAEAAEDVVKAKSSGNVFDRLGRGMDVSESPDQHVEFREFVAEDDEYGDFSQNLVENQSLFLKRNEYAEQQVGNVAALHGETGLASDFISENERFDDFNVMGHGIMDVSQTAMSVGNNAEDSVMVQYNIPNDNKVMQLTRNKDQDPSVGAASSSHKIANISMNVNTWKAPHYQQPREVADLGPQKSVQESGAIAGKSSFQPMKENGNSVTVGYGNAKSAGDIQKENQKPLQSAPGSYAVGHPLEDPDSRTIFVSNVHFAASKDNLSQHFNKFGEVLKVIMVTDAATGQPRGSAYVEFMHKEAADNALSLDGTSFMSRMLKVVKRSFADQEAASTLTWLHVPRSSSFSGGRFPKASFSRGMAMAGIFRPWLSVKSGARSLQWKRDAQATPESGPPVPRNSVSTPIGRSLTYVRTEPKKDGKSGR